MFGFGGRQTTRRKKVVKFADSKRLLIIVTASQCPGCSTVKGQIKGIRYICNRRNIDFIHITGSLGPDLIGKLNFHHPALIGVCKSTPSIFSITEITKQSFNYKMCELGVAQMLQGPIIEWWSKLTPRLHDKTATFRPKSTERMNVQTNLVQIEHLYVMNDTINLSSDCVNMVTDNINC